MCRCIRAVAPLKAEPREEAEQISQALFGEVGAVLEVRERWLKLRLRADGYEGWVPLAAFALKAEHELIAPTHVVSVPRALCFPRADIKAAPARPLFMGSPLVARAQQGEFIALADGGFVHKRHARAVDTPALADAATLAERLLHAPYLWGGRTVAGIDCSGLVQLALRMAGYEDIPRDSGDQARSVGQELPLTWLEQPAKLKRGDLVFWKGHVAMLLDASRIIHANATHMMVAIEPLKEALARIARDGSQPLALRRP